MQTIKTMRKAIFQNKLTICKANLPPITIRPKNYKKSLLCGLISQTSAEKLPKNGGVKRLIKAGHIHNIRHALKTNMPY